MIKLLFILKKEEVFLIIFCRYMFKISLFLHNEVKELEKPTSSKCMNFLMAIFPTAGLLQAGLLQTELLQAELLQTELLQARLLQLEEKEK